MQGLRSAHGFLQRRIAAELRLKRTPTLDFHYDATTDRAMRLEELLRQQGQHSEPGQTQGGHLAPPETHEEGSDPRGDA